MKNPIRLGIVGVGRAGRHMHLKELCGKEDQFTIAAVCDTEPARMHEVAKEYNAKAYIRIEELVMDPDVEIVDIVTRSCDHFRHAMTALDAGKIVFLEKPFCTNYEDAKILSEKGKGRLFIRHNRRFEAKFMQVKEIIDSKILGDVYAVKLARNHFNCRMDWQTLREYGGGKLLNWGPHIVDHALYFCGGDYTEISAYTKQIASAGDAEDYVKVTFVGVNGRIVEMELGDAVALHSPEYIIYGNRGTLIDNGTTYTLRYLPEDFEMPKMQACHATPYTDSYNAHKFMPPLSFVQEEKVWNTNVLDQTWNYLYDTVRNGKPYPITDAEALQVMKAIGDIQKTM